VQYVTENALFIFKPGFLSIKLSEKHGKRFPQDILVMEHWYKGKWSTAMLGDYCWMMKRDASETKYH